MDMDMELKMKEICEMKEKLVCCVKSEINKGLEHVDTKELGEAIDMIKDLAETEKSCYEACYYKTVTEAMEDSGERYGYNHYHYASGRFAPSGHGTRMGYDKTVPVNYMRAYLDNPSEFEHHMHENTRMGYDDGNTGGRSSTRSNPMSGYSPMWIGEMDGDWDDRYGKSYNQYKTAKRYYTETHSPHDKDTMDTHAEQHVMDTIVTVKEIYRNAEPDLKKRIKENFTKLLSDMV